MAPGDQHRVIGKKKKKPIEMKRLLAAIPAANQAVRQVDREQSTVLYLPLKQQWWTGALSRLLPIREEKGYELDGLGLEVWRACDGKRTTEQIVETFAQRHRLAFHEARLTVLNFLRMLVERDLVVMLGHDD